MSEIEALRGLAEELRGEIIYMHKTGDVEDSRRNSAELLARAERLLGPVVAE